MNTLKLFLIILFAGGTLSAQTFTLKSAEVGGQATSKQVFKGFGCNGQNISPELSWSHAPKGTRSFALTMYDPDAPTGSGWWHWVVFDIPANATRLESGAGDPAGTAAPKGAIQSMTDFGKPGYGGPCPPKGGGPHAYLVTVYALKTAKLGLDKNASPALVGFNLNANTLAKASIVFYYERK